jgi:hypothetical protein
MPSVLGLCKSLRWKFISAKYKGKKLKFLHNKGYQCQLYDTWGPLKQFTIPFFISYLFSSFISLNRLPLRSRHASLFVVFSICAPIARNMEPKPETVQLIKWKWWPNNYYFPGQGIYDTRTLQSTYNLSDHHWKVHCWESAWPGITTITEMSNQELQLWLVM